MNVSRNQRGLVAVSMLSAMSFAAPCTDASLSPPAPMPPISHVFVIVLENQGFDTTFAPTTRATYLADTLVKLERLVVDRAALLVEKRAPHLDPLDRHGVAVRDDGAQTQLVGPVGSQVIANEVDLAQIEQRVDSGLQHGRDRDRPGQLRTGDTGDDGDDSRDTQNPANKAHQTHQGKKRRP